MQSQNRLFDDLARVASGAVGALAGVRKIPAANQARVMYANFWRGGRTCRTLVELLERVEERVRARGRGLGGAAKAPAQALSLIHI